MAEDISNYRIYLQEYYNNPGKINKAEMIIKDFFTYLEKVKKSIDVFTADDFYGYSEYIIEKESDTYEHFSMLIKYGYFTENKQLIISCMEILDGFEMVTNLYDRLKIEYGDPLCDKIFENIDIPSPALHQKTRAEIMLLLIDRMLQYIPRKEVKSFLNSGLRNKYTKWYEVERKKYLKSKNLKNYIKLRQINFLDTMKKHNMEKSLFFTQEITDQVLEFIQNNSQISAGELVGDRINLSKIPYLTHKYLLAKDKGDEKVKYFGCHNPWIRGAFIDNEMVIDPIVCEISCGFLKDFWEGILREPVEVRVINSLIKGGDLCNFEIKISPKS